MTTNLIITGVTGRMGKRIKALAEIDTDLTVTGEADRNTNLEEVIHLGDVIIDFTLPEATSTFIEIAAKHKTPIVIGTTGLKSEQEAKIKEASQSIPIVYAPNMSVGVNTLFAATQFISQALGTDFSIRLDETHHVHKKDKPSGTAYGILDMALPARNQTRSDIALHDGAEQTDSKTSDVNVHVYREGEVIGDHSIMFENDMESVTISHHAKNRDIFAAGSLRAAKWIADKPARLYSMMDVLGLTL